MVEATSGSLCDDSDSFSRQRRVLYRIMKSVIKVVQNYC